jgi:hypothetical protein
MYRLRLLFGCSWVWISLVVAFLASRLLRPSDILGISAKFWVDDRLHRSEVLFGFVKHVINPFAAIVCHFMRYEINSPVPQNFDLRLLFIGPVVKLSFIRKPAFLNDALFKLNNVALPLCGI